MDIQVTGGFWFVNTGTVVPDGNTRRRWIACREYGFLSAGQGLLYKQDISKLLVDDIVCAYESKKGYRAIGRVLDQAVRINDYLFNGADTLRGIPFIADDLFDQSEDEENSEYVVRVHWFPLNPQPLLISRNSPGFFAPRNTVAELHLQATKTALERHFACKFT